MENLLQFIDPQHINSILDVGIGSGDFAALVAGLFPEACITGADPSDEALAEARKIHENFSFFRMEAEQLDFADNTFDLVTMSNALHHLSHPDKAISEMKRVARNKGWIVISEIIADGLNAAQENQKLYHHHRSYIDRLNGISHRETYSRNEVLKLIAENGLSPYHTFYFNRITEPETSPEKLTEWVNKMESYQKYIPEGTNTGLLKEWLKQFKERVFIHGFQPATNLVAVIRNHK